MENNERIANIIEDYALMRHTIDCIGYALKEGKDMPNYIPVMNDGVITDQLSKICETITTLRKKLL